MELKNKPIKDATIVIRIDSETLKTLEMLSKKHRVSRAEVIRQLIEKYNHLIK